MLFQTLFNELSTFAESSLGLGLRLKVWLLANLSGLSFALAGYWIDTHVDRYVWRPSTTYYLVVALIVADFGSAAWYAWKQDKFETRKALRSVWKLASYSFLLAVAYNLGKHEAILAWLPSAVMGPMVVILLLSLLKNLSLLGWIDPRLARVLYRKIDTYKNPPAPDDKA